MDAGISDDHAAEVAKRSAGSNRFTFTTSIFKDRDADFRLFEKAGGAGIHFDYAVGLGTPPARQMPDYQCRIAIKSGESRVTTLRIIASVCSRTLQSYLRG